MPSPTPFTRYHHPDPTTDRIVQDIYDKIAQSQQSVGGVQDSVQAVADRSTRMYFGSHSARLSNFSASRYSPGTQYFETDRGALYYTNGETWNLVVGISVGQLSARWDDLGKNGAGFIYGDPSVGSLWRWSGAVWESLIVVPDIDPSAFYETPSVASSDSADGLLSDSYQRDWSSDIADLQVLIASIQETVQQAVSADVWSSGSGYIYFNSGRVVIGSVVDDGVNRLQVTGDSKISGNEEITGKLTVCISPYSLVNAVATTGPVNLRTSSGAVAPLGQYICAVYLTVSPSGVATVQVALSWKDSRGLTVSRTVTYGPSALAGVASDMFSIESDGSSDVTISSILTNTATFNVYASLLRTQ